MSEITTLLSSENVVVLGPPSNVTVQTDIGPSGSRGSKIFVGIGHPNTNGINDQQEILLNDIFINNLFGSQYSYMYQYISQPAGNTWVPVLKVNPTIYSNIYVTTFSDGNASITIPISSITDANTSSLTAANFSIQMTPIHYNPIAISITSVVLTGSGNDQLTINLSALEKYTDWQKVDETMSINLFITMVSI